MTTETAKAFNASYLLDARSQLSDESWEDRVHQELKSYIEEYAFQQKTHFYDLDIQRDDQGQIETVYKKGYENKGDILNTFHSQGRRGQADYEGFLAVRDALKDPTAIGTYFVILSPPGTKEEGFGDYNMAFIGRVDKNRLAMVAYRNNLSLEDQRKFVNKFLPDGSALPENARDTDFLKTPIFLPKDLELGSHLDVVKLLDKQIEAEDNSDLMKELRPLREKVLSAFKTGNKTLMTQSFSELEMTAKSVIRRKKGQTVSNSSSAGVGGGGGVDTGSCGEGGISFSEDPAFTSSIWSGGTGAEKSCQKIKCGRPGCGWEASAADIIKIRQGRLRCCPKKDSEGKVCGWKPG